MQLERMQVDLYERPHVALEEFDFAGWLDAVGLTRHQAAERLGVSYTFITMLLSDPSMRRYRKPSKRLQMRCRDIAMERMKEIERFANPDWF